jgi:LacI family transcriptional regulator
MIQGMQDAAWAHGMMLILASTSSNPELERAALGVMLERQVDAVIYAAMYHRTVTPPAELATVPAALVDCYSADRSLPSVVPDEVQGGRTATEVLLRRGHRRIAFINSADPIPAAAGRLAGYQQALTNYGLAIDPRLVRSDYAPWAAAGYRCMRELLELPEPPTGVFCFNDQTAMGAYEAIKERGLSIPNDIAMVGFDNHELIAAALRPPLTTLELPHYAMGQWAVEHLVADSSQGSLPAPVQHRLECPLVERESV